MRALKGGGTVEAGRHPITIVPTTAAEVEQLQRFARRAVRRLPHPWPNIIQPHQSNEIILSFADAVDPAVILRQFKEALRACQSES